MTTWTSNSPIPSRWRSCRIINDRQEYTKILTPAPKQDAKDKKQEKKDKKQSTKDGVTVAKEIELEDKFENTGAQLVKSVASKTGDDAGDGTTTATILTQAIVTEGLKNVTAGANPMDLKRGIDKAVKRYEKSN